MPAFLHRGDQCVCLNPEATYLAYVLKFSMAVLPTSTVAALSFLLGVFGFGLSASGLHRDCHNCNSVSAGKKEHALHLCGIFVGNVPVLVRAQLNVDPQAGCILKVRNVVPAVGVNLIFLNSKTWLSVEVCYRESNEVKDVEVPEVRPQNKPRLVWYAHGKGEPQLTCRESAGYVIVTLYLFRYNFSCSAMYATLL